MKIRSNLIQLELNQMYQINDTGSSDIIMLCWLADAILTKSLIQYPDFRDLTKSFQNLKGDTKR